MNNLKRAFAEKRWITSVQLDPFKSSSADFMKKLLLDLKEIGIVIADINSSAKGTKQDSLQMAAGIEALGLSAIPHITARDSLTEAVLSQVLGAYSWGGVRNVLVIKGDPKEKKRSRRFRGGVYEHDSTELIRRLVAFKIERELDLSVGCAFSQTRPGKKMIYELKRLERKISAGADFVMTQPVFYHPAWKRELGFLKASISKPFLAGLWPIFDLE